MTVQRTRLIAAGLTVVLALVYLFAPMAGSGQSGMDVESFGALPALYSGRNKPIDSIARNSLLTISGRQSVRVGDSTLDADSWLLELWTRPMQAADTPIFRVDHPSIRATLGLTDASAKRFSFNAIVARSEELQRQLQLASQVPTGDQDLFQRRILQLGDQLSLYQSLSGMVGLSLVPPDDGSDNWLPLSVAAAPGQSQRSRDIAAGYSAAFEAYRNHDVVGFNRVVADLHATLAALQPGVSDKALHEAQLNRADLFGRAVVLYVMIGLLVAVSWLRWREPLTAAASALLLLTLLVHTIGLIARIYLSGRPPVTNLYSSALFIGWGAVVCCVALVWLFRNSMGLIMGSVIGCLTLLVAQGLSGNGDSLAVLQAVLDTNFWLATHVIVITLGYSATYLAGFLGLAYVVRRTFTRTFTKADGARLGQMIYGIVCFATLLSFLGTILGGIWADQSWGRFWGWDPKENGALIIVLWNALILHARWGGMVSHRGIALLAIFGNIITSWSWFGVNMLGRGLHSYGFIDSAAFWLVVFVCAQLVAIGIGLIPRPLMSAPAAPAPRAKSLVNGSVDA